MRRSRRWLRFAGMVVASFVVAVAATVLITHTDHGRRAIERLLAAITQGQVRIAGLSGDLFGTLRIARLELVDADGPWLTAGELTLRARPLGLLAGRIELAAAVAASVVVTRAPRDGRGSGGRTDPLTYARRVEVDDLEVGRVVLGPALVGAPAVLHAEGSLRASGAGPTHLELVVNRLDQPGDYRARVELDAARVAAALDVTEPARGPLAALLGVPEIGALAVHIGLNGPRRAEVLDVDAHAGGLGVRANGTLDWARQEAEVDLRAESGELRLRPDCSWTALKLVGHWHGPLRAPTASLEFELAGLAAGRAALGTLTADASVAGGVASLRATLSGLALAGMPAALLGTHPVEVRLDGRPQDPEPTLSFSVSHPLGSLTGHAALAARARTEFRIELPSVAPFTRLAGLELDGRGTLTGALSGWGDDADATLAAALDGAAGASAWGRLLGPAARMDLALRRHAGTLSVQRAELVTTVGRASLSGDVRDGNLNLAWEARIPVMAALDAAIVGTFDGSGTLRGPLGEFVATAVAQTHLSVHGSRPGVVSLSVTATGLPQRPTVGLTAAGRLDDAPLQLSASIASAAGGLQVAIRQASWKSGEFSGDFSIPAGLGSAHGSVAFGMRQLDDLVHVVGEPLGGRFHGEVRFSSEGGRPYAQLDVAAHDLRARGAALDSLVVSGRIDDLLSRPVIALRLLAEGIGPPAVAGHAAVGIRGPMHALAVQATAGWLDRDHGPAELESTALLDVGARRLAIATLDARARGERLYLLRPAMLDAADGLSVDDLRIGIDAAVLEFSGRVAPVLDARASVRALSPRVLAPFFPEQPAEGTIAAEAILTGTLSAPRGTVDVRATGLRATGDIARALPAAAVLGSAALAGDSATVEFRMTAGSLADLRVAGVVPLFVAAGLDVHATGHLSLALLDPFIEPQGRRLRGEARLDAALSGSFDAPTLLGTASVTHGDIQDFVNGLHLSEASLEVAAKDGTVRVTHFSAHAGRGTVDGEGTIALLAPGIPVDLRIMATNALAVSNDLLTATVDASLSVAGRVDGLLTVAGHVKALRADINVPNALPHEVAVLDVRRAVARRSRPKAMPMPALGLDLKVEAERAVFVRGRGLDAELGGELGVSGTTQAPHYAGGFTMRRGTLALAGASLKFTRGEVSFNGTSERSALDPTLDFTAESSSNDVTASLVVGGFASSPTITLTSTPDLPQDEILARLLFGVSAKQIAPLQMLSIGVALASISGVGAGTLDPMAAVQRRLGLDRLSVGGGTGTDANAAVVEAGRYLTDRVYVGATQSTSGVTKFQAQIDLTRRLKLQTVVGNGSSTAQGTTPQNDPGNTLTLLYQIDF
jgi:translocation and assembly module TamB